MTASKPILQGRVLRTLATLRILANKLEYDRSEAAQSNQIFLFDTNVIRLFCDPYQDRNLLSLFLQRSRADAVHSDILSAAEDRLIFAFALQETNAIPSHFAHLETHVLAPHRRELSHFIRNVRDGLITSLRRPFDQKQAATFKKNVRELERLVDRNASSRDIIRYLEEIYQNEMVSTINVLTRMRSLFRGSLKFEQHWMAQEQQIEVDPQLWEFFNDYLFSHKQANAAEGHWSELTFNIGRDSEALALVCGLAQKGYCPIFVTADSTINEVVDRIYFDPGVKVPEWVRKALPEKAFVRHPIAYTSLISEFSQESKAFVPNAFLKDVDFAFLSIIANEPHDRLLARFAYKPATANLSYAPRFRDPLVQKLFAESLEKIQRRLLFVHERDAAQLAFLFLEEVKKGTFKSVTSNTVRGALSSWTQRSVADLEDTLSKLGMVGVGHATVVKRGADGPAEPTAVQIILDEWNDGKPNTRRTNQHVAALERRLPGFIRLEQPEVDYLKSLSGLDASKLSEVIDHDSIGHSAGVFLANALVCAVQNEWLVSERFAVHSCQRAKDSEVRIKREAYYWSALARRHQQHPGGQRLSEALQDLEAGLALCNQEEDRLRFRSEMVALALASSYHAYFYSATQAYEAIEIDYEQLYDDLTNLEISFGREVHLPYDAIQSRLAAQIYGNLTLLALFGFGLPPGKSRNHWYERHKFLPFFHRFEDVLASRSNPSLYTQFLFSASQYLADTNRTRRANLLKEIKSIRARGKETGALIPYDEKKIADFVDLCGE